MHLPELGCIVSTVIGDACTCVCRRARACTTDRFMKVDLSTYLAAIPVSRAPFYMMCET